MEDTRWNGIVESIKALPLDEVIDGVLREAGVKGETNPLHRGFLCPFHDDHSGGHAGIYTNAKGQQLFHCFVCGETLNVFSFVMKLKHVSYRQAVCDLAVMFSLMSPEEYRQETNGEYASTVYKADRYVRRRPGFARTNDVFLLNTVYGVLAKGEMLKGSKDPLSEQDRKYLNGRGIHNWEIDFYGYFTMPKESELPEILKELQEKGIHPEDLYGVPGFYHDIEHDCVRLSEKDGIGIPLRDGWRNIVAIQVRDRNPKAKPRYKYLSSKWADGTDKNEKKYDRGCGPASVTAVLFPYHIDHLDNGICITEGVFKAAQFAQQCDGIGLSVQGVNNISSVLPTLELLERRKLFLKNDKTVRPEIWLAFDMDMYENVQVFKAAVKLRQTLEKAGWKVKYMSWNPEYKGLDDFLIARRDGKHPGRLDVKEAGEFEKSVALHKA